MRRAVCEKPDKLVSVAIFAETTTCDGDLIYLPSNMPHCARDDIVPPRPLASSLWRNTPAWLPPYSDQRTFPCRAEAPQGCSAQF